MTAAAAIACALAQVQAQMVPAPVDPPPEKMVINIEGRRSCLGYVVALSYFSEAEMQDPLWEFARAKTANMWWCQSEARLRRRDVRWVPANHGSGEQCAMVIYTSECPDPRDVADKTDPPYANRLEQDLETMMTQPVPGPSGPGCGQKDRGRRDDPQRR